MICNSVKRERSSRIDKHEWKMKVTKSRLHFIMICFFLIFRLFQVPDWPTSWWQYKCRGGTRHVILFPSGLRRPIHGSRPQPLASEGRPSSQSHLIRHCRKDLLYWGVHSIVRVRHRGVSGNKFVLNQKRRSQRGRSSAVQPGLVASYLCLFIFFGNLEKCFPKR